MTHKSEITVCYVNKISVCPIYYYKQCTLKSVPNSSLAQLKKFYELQGKQKFILFFLKSA